MVIRNRILLLQAMQSILATLADTQEEMALLQEEKDLCSEIGANLDRLIESAAEDL